MKEDFNRGLGTNPQLPSTDKRERGQTADKKEIEGDYDKKLAQKQLATITAFNRPQGFSVAGVEFGLSQSQVLVAAPKYETGMRQPSINSDISNLSGFSEVTQ